MDPFRGYKNAIDDQLADATAVLDAFHVVKLATQAVDEVRRRVQQDTLGHRGLANDPLYKIRTILRSGAENLTLRQQHRLAEAIAADARHEEVYVAWQCAQRVRDVYHAPDPATGRAMAEKILAGFPSCPIPEMARLGRTLKQWADAFLGYFRTGGANNGGTEAIQCRRRHWMAYADVWVMPTLRVSVLVNARFACAVVGIIGAVQPSPWEEVTGHG